MVKNEVQKIENINYWTENTNLEWYKRQFENPYRRTIGFEQFVSNIVNMDNSTVLDVAGGCGSATDYIAQRHPSSNFVVQDINTELFSLYVGKSNNIRFEYGDIFNMSDENINRFDGIMCIQTLSWLPSYREAIVQLCKLNPKWICFSSLFYPGKINYTIKLENFERPTRDSLYSEINYNIYSVPLLRELFSKLGYNKMTYVPFEIDIDLSKPEHYDLGNYTIETVEGKRMLFNTCLYMPEGFVLVQK